MNNKRIGVNVVPFTNAQGVAFPANVSIEAPDVSASTHPPDGAAGAFFLYDIKLLLTCSRDDIRDQSMSCRVNRFTGIQKNVRVVLQVNIPWTNYTCSSSSSTAANRPLNSAGARGVTTNVLTEAHSLMAS